MGEANPLSLTIENKGHILSPKEHELYQRVVGSIIHWNRKVELRNNAIFCQLGSSLFYFVFVFSYFHLYIFLFLTLHCS